MNPELTHNIQPLLTRTYPRAVRAKGVFIYDTSGKFWLDGSSGAITCSLGHAHPRVTEVMRSQSERLHFVYRSQFGSEEAEQLASMLARISPGKSYQHTFFVNSGTEAMETAMKIAWQHWQESGLPQKRRFITRRKSYHGITMGALSLSGHPLRRQRFEDLLEPYPLLQADLEHDPVEKQVAELAAVVESIGADQIAAFVAEPVVGAAGAALHPPPGYYSAMTEYCRRNQILFIADEVMTGLGRTGEWFGLDHWHAVADICVVGKSLGAGYTSIAATLMTSQVLEPIRKGSALIMSGHTYSANPLSCGTALEVLRIIEDEGLLDQVRSRGSVLMDALNKFKDEFSFISQARGKGLMTGLEFDPKLKGFQAKLINRCFENGLLVYPSVGGPQGTDENAILIAPPFIISPVELEQLIRILHKSLQEVSNMTH